MRRVVTPLRALSLQEAILRRAILQEAILREAKSRARPRRVLRWARCLPPSARRRARALRRARAAPPLPALRNRASPPPHHRPRARANAADRVSSASRARPRAEVA